MFCLVICNKEWLEINVTAVFYWGSWLIEKELFVLVVNINSLEWDWLRQAELCHRHTMMKKKRGRQKKRWEDNIKEWREWTLPAQLGRLKTVQDGKGLLPTHLWCPEDLPRLLDRIEKEITMCVFHKLLFTSFPFALKYGMWGLSLRKSCSIS